jgi:hypothetical protein
MAGTAYAINVVMTNGMSGYVKFYGDGTWDWHIVQDVDEATLYSNKDECIDDFYKYVVDCIMDGNVNIRVDRSRCRISECYCPWL